MDREFAAWSFLQLLLVMCVFGHGSCREMSTHEKNLDTFIRLPANSNNKEKENGVHAYYKHSSSFSFVVFFTMNDLKKGKKLSVYLPPLDPSSNPPLLSREEAESIPFSYKQLPYLLEFFSYSPDSPQGKAIEEAIRACESKPIKGEIKFCATSFESMLDFVHKMFGSEESNIKAITSTHLTKSKTHLQNYTILQEPQEISAPKFVGCHLVSYPYALFHCHSQIETKVLRISLGGHNGDRIEAIAVCHFDTSQWNPDHQAFRETGTKPGQSELCHFLPADHMVWVPAGLIQSEIINDMYYINYNF